LLSFTAGLEMPPEFQPKPSVELPPYDPTRREFRILDHVRPVLTRSGNYWARCTSCAQQDGIEAELSLLRSGSYCKQQCCHLLTRYFPGNESLSNRNAHGYNSHEGKWAMRSVNVAKLKNQLSKYLTFAKGGEEIVIRDRNLPVAKLVPFSTDEGSEEELLLVAAGKMRLPKAEVKLAELTRIPTGTVAGNEAIGALVEDRDESL